MQYTTFLVLLRSIFAPKMKTAPQWNWVADVVKDLLLFEPEKWSFFFDLTQTWSGKVTEFRGRPFFFGNHLISAGNAVSILMKTSFFGDHLILTEKPPQSDSRLMKTWVKFVYCCFQLPKKPPLCEFLATRLSLNLSF